MEPRAQKVVSAVVAAVGVGLLAMMVMTEGEPGFVPLALILLGAAGYGGALMRERSPRSS